MAARVMWVLRRRRPHVSDNNLSVYCPCTTAGRNAEAVGESCCFCGFLALCTFSYINIFSNNIIRGKIRDNSALTKAWYATAWRPRFVASVAPTSSRDRRSRPANRRHTRLPRSNPNVLASVTQTPWGGSTFKPVNFAWDKFLTSE